ncbi:hypothetical protein A2U01_0107476, partial [Trifolium medium]|nr:hypothetical protein [Trifolium medium]
MNSGCQNGHKSTVGQPVNSDLRRAREELRRARLAEAKRVPQALNGAGHRGYCTGRRS